MMCRNPSRLLINLNHSLYTSDDIPMVSRLCWSISYVHERDLYLTFTSSSVDLVDIPRILKELYTALITPPMSK